MRNGFVRSIGARLVEFLGSFQFSQSLQAFVDLNATANNECATADGNQVAMAQDTKMNFFIIDFAAVGAFEVSQHEIAVVLLDFNVEAANAFVVELD